VTHIVQNAITAVSLDKSGYIGGQFFKGRQGKLALDSDGDITMFFIIDA
jgi:hypothetical protein